MSLPGGVTVQIGFGLDPLNIIHLAFGSKTDVTDDVRRAEWTTSARSSQFDTFQAGQLTFELNNPDGDYTPADTSGAYYGDWKRNTPIWVYATHESSQVLQWFGFLRTATVSYQGSHHATTRVTAIDPLGFLADQDLESIVSAYRGDTVATRLGRILDAVGWPTQLRDLGNGGSTATLAPTTLGGTALAACREAAETEAGMFYAQRDGYLVHDSRHAVAETRQSTSQLTITGDLTIDAGDLLLLETSDEVLLEGSGSIRLETPGTVSPNHLYGSLRMSGIGEGFRNIVRVTGESGNTQTEDLTSSGEGRVTYDRTLDMEADDEAAAVAEWWADLYGTETPFPAETTSLVAVTGRTLTSVLAEVKLRDRVTVQHTTPGSGDNIDHECMVDGIRGRVDPSAFYLTFFYSSADAYDDNLSAAPSEWLIWDSGVWDTGKWAY